MHRSAIAALAAAMAMGVETSASQVPPDIAAKIKAVGGKIDPSIGPLYAPLLPLEPYAGVTVTRDQTYGADPLQKLDVFTPA